MTSAPAHSKDSGGDSSGPRHVAIIMDGNGRWAKRRLLPRIAGHRRGIEAVRKVVEAAPGLGVKVLTLYAFSSENWTRPEDEVNGLMGLLRHYLGNEIAELHAKGVRLSIIGDYRKFSPDLVRLLDHSMDMTAGNTKLDLVLALNYGGQDELVRAVRAIADDVQAGRITPDAVDAGHIEARLDTRRLPLPDLIIRTSGEVRLSNFLLWQAAYAELLFVDTLWPDFDGAALADAVNVYLGRHRRYGAL